MYHGSYGKYFLLLMRLKIFTSESKTYWREFLIIKVIEGQSNEKSRVSLYIYNKVINEIFNRLCM